jgi:hypothetical protein
MPFALFDVGTFLASRIEFEADLGQRSFHDFYQIAGPLMLQ